MGKYEWCNLEGDCCGGAVFYTIGEQLGDLSTDDGALDRLFAVTEVWAIRPCTPVCTWNCMLAC